MIRKVILSVLLCLPLLSVGQQANINVQSFTKFQTDLMARVFEPKIDQNGNKCAIIRVVTTETGFAWEPDGFGIIDSPYKTGEYWLYVPGGAQRLTIKHPRLGILRNYMYPEPIEPGCVYEMRLVTGKVTVFVEDVVSQFLVIKAEPKTATIYFNNELVATGEYHERCKPGSYTYRVEAPLYHTDAGKLEMGIEKKTVDVRLKPAFGYIEISTEPENEAQVTIDGELLQGLSPIKSARLKSGEHIIRVFKDMYAPASQKVIVTDGQTTPIVLRMKPNFAELTVKTGTMGGEIFLNDIKKGNDTWTGRVKVGKNVVEVRKEHYRPHRQEIETVIGEVKAVTLEPTPKKGNLSVTTTPMDATIYIGGKAYGVSPNVISGLLEGDYVVELAKTNYISDKRYISISEGKTTDLDATLKMKATLEMKKDEVADEVARMHPKKANHLLFYGISMPLSGGSGSLAELTYGYVGKKGIGFYVQMKTNFSFEPQGKFDYKYEDGELYMSLEENSNYLGDIHTSRFGCTAGMLWRLFPYLFIKGGAGYGFRNKIIDGYRDNAETLYDVLYKEESHQSVEFDIGLMLKIRRMGLMVGMSGIGGEYFEAGVGVGFFF